MVVQHNLQALNTSRQLKITGKTLAGSVEKLSSGYKINRAADDAAGLSISEKMRKQIRGLMQASVNAEDGISLIQTAEGALNEVHDMLHRMNELAVKAANDTNSEADRRCIQDEIDQIKEEIDRVSVTTKFNEIYLLDGHLGNPSKSGDTQRAFQSYMAEKDALRTANNIEVNTSSISNTGNKLFTINDIKTLSGIKILYEDLSDTVSALNELDITERTDVVTTTSPAGSSTASDMIN